MIARKQFRRFCFTILLFWSGFIAPKAKADILQVDHLWSLTLRASPELRAEELRVEEARLLSDRAHRHWLPRLGVSGRWWMSDDPTAGFVGILGQRAVGTGDFVPQTLNNPGWQGFRDLGLDLELSLFDGGASLARANSGKVGIEIARLEQDLKVAGTYLRLITDYGSVIIFQDTVRDLQSLQKDLVRVLEHYSVGQAGNLLGYSGLLGLKGLKIRLESELRLMSQRQSLIRERVSALAGLTSGDWTAESMPIDKYLDSFLKIAHEGTLSSDLARRRAFQADEERMAEKSNFLPKISFFGRGALMAGERGAANSAAGGVLFRWTLFNPSEFGRYSEATASAERAISLSEQALLNEGVRERRWVSEEMTFRENYKSMIESEQIIGEQVHTALKLFHSGIIGGLQLSEVLNRRVDLAFAARDLKVAWLNSRAESRQNTRWNENSRGRD